MGMMVGFEHRLIPERAADFIQNRLPLHDGPVVGKAHPERFHIAQVQVDPIIRVDQAGGSWRLQVSFAGEEGEADPLAALSAWRGGRSLVPLLDGGYAPLPLDWLARHGPLLRELLEARNARGEVGRNATAALVELLEDTEAEVPLDLRRLRNFLEGGEGLPEVELPRGFQGTLRGYQQTGHRWLRFLASMDLNGILADDMGLGKTVQALVALADMPGPHLVVAPTSVLPNWERESKRFCPLMTVNLYHGPHRQLDSSQLTLTSYALLRIDAEKLRDKKWTYVVLDEAQAIKNASSKTARVAYKVDAKHRLCLTGTPVENRLEELWSLFRFLMPGLLGGLDAFRERFARPIENGDDSARRTLRGRVRPYVLRRLKQQVASELPKLTDIVMPCEMSEAQRRVYEAVRLTARQDVARALGDSNQRGATFQILEALLRMRQACCDPTLLPGDFGEAPSCKLDRLDELLVDLVCGDHKALIFSQWTSLLDRVEPRLEQLGIEWLRLDGSTRHRQPIIDEFQSNGGPPVFLLSLKAGGFGLNLTAADYVVHLDPWWNPAIQQQATDRAHRIGQDKPVFSCRLIASGTVEERILELQEAKRNLADAALGKEGGFVKALTSDELRSLFDAS
ncbi:MAG: DEAD/DEAH box helicase [Proteobacteria bacterium]|nr:DEAD/DEAH box helicase [Pseudomonadota bacterium]